MLSLRPGMDNNYHHTVKEPESSLRARIRVQDFLAEEIGFLDRADLRAFTPRTRPQNVLTTEILGLCDADMIEQEIRQSFSVDWVIDRAGRFPRKSGFRCMCWPGSPARLVSRPRFRPQPSPHKETTDEISCVFQQCHCSRRADIRREAERLLGIRCLRIDARAGTETCLPAMATYKYRIVPMGGASTSALSRATSDPVEYAGWH
jgi:hypothetical protein